MNIKLTAPHLNAYIQTHKQDRPIRPVINNIPTPSYKTAKLLNKKTPTISKFTKHIHNKELA